MTRAAAKSTTAATGREPRANGKRRKAIVRRAAEIFEDKGFAHTTIEDIAGAVGVTREAIYYYFPDKVEILHEIIKPESDYLLWSMERIEALSLPADEKLVMAIESHMMRFNPNYLEMAIALREMHGKTSDARIIALRRIWKRYEQMWVDLIAQGRRENLFSPALDPKLTAFAILGMCNSPSAWFNPGRGVTMDELVATFTRLIMAGIRTAPSDLPLPADGARSVLEDGP